MSDDPVSEAKKAAARMAVLDDDVLERIASAYAKYIRINGPLNNPGLTAEYEAVKAELERRKAR